MSNCKFLISVTSLSLTFTFVAFFFSSKLFSLRLSTFSFNFCNIEYICSIVAI